MQVPIVFCADGNYGRYLPVAAQSIIENSAAEHEYHIIIFDCGIRQEDLAALERQIARYPHFRLRAENITAWLESQQHIIAKSGWNKGTYGRLLVPKLCASYEKVIYADVDMVFNCDMAELAAMDLGGNYIAAAPSVTKEIYRANGDRREVSFIRSALGMADDQLYVNAGLLLFNIAAWRAHALADKTLQMLADNALRFPDQDAINAVCKGHIHYLDQRWNCIIHVGGKWQRLAAEKARRGRVRKLYRQWLAADADGKAVFHYCGIKPWQSLLMPKSAVWWRYAAKTETCRQLWAEAQAFYNQAELARMGEPLTFRLLGLPLFSVRAWAKRKKYYLGARRARHIAKSRFNRQTGYFAFYLLGIKLFSRRPRS